MNDRFFLDTNVFIYAFDASNRKKQQMASELIKTALTHHKGCISYQVIQEFLNVATRKFAVPLSANDCKKYLDRVLGPLCEVFTSFELYVLSLDIMERWQFAFYDSLIIAAALHANCTVLYSEELQHGQMIQKLTIQNPFL